MLCYSLYTVNISPYFYACVSPVALGIVFILTILYLTINAQVPVQEAVCA